MQAVVFNCPACGERGKAPAELLGQAVTCPSCSRDFIAARRKANWIPGAALILIGAAVATVTFSFQSSLPTEAVGLGDVVGIVLIGCGIASLLWLANEIISTLAVPLAIMAGFAILVGSLFARSTVGAIAGGCVMIVGAVFLAARKR